MVWRHDIRQRDGVQQDFESKPTALSGHELAAEGWPHRGQLLGGRGEVASRGREVPVPIHCRGGPHDLAHSLHAVINELEDPWLEYEPSLAKLKPREFERQREVRKSQEGAELARLPAGEPQRLGEVRQLEEKQIATWGVGGGLARLYSTNERKDIVQLIDPRLAAQQRTCRTEATSAALRAASDYS